MTDSDLKVFVDGTAKFFTQVATSPAEVSTPYVREDSDRVTFDFSAVIGVSGTQRGCVYYSAPRKMVEELMTMVGESDHSDENCADFVGEIANTISGNAREFLGSGFMISVPVVFYGPSGDVRFPQEMASFVIPIIWNRQRSSLIICLRDQPKAKDAVNLELDVVEV
ncbi:MAG: chemotaxis protein CheX [Vulcanimicrobiaceae bacterium]